MLRAQADGFIVVNPGPDHWSAPYAFAPLEITYHHVNVKINGQIATTVVDQEFYNPNPRRLEGTYLFPVPKGAQIDKFSMEIGGRQVDAELLAADKARSIYEDIVRKLRDPALLEYAGRDVFKVRVFPIEPNSPKRIRISYSQLLPAESGLISYVYPLNTEKFSAKPIKSVSVKVDLDTSKPLKTIYSPSHAVEIKRDGLHRATASYEAGDVRPDTDFALYFAQEKDEVGVNLLTTKSAGEDGYFLLLASPGVETKSTKPAPKDVAFVLDTSGSMSGKKIEQAKKALQFCVENLNDSDRFEVMRFSTDVEPLFGKLAEASKQQSRTGGEFRPGPQGQRRHRHRRRSAPGARPRGPPRHDRPFVIVFLTDGEPTVGETDENTIVAQCQKRGRGPHACLLLRHRRRCQYTFAGQDRGGNARRHAIRFARGGPGDQSLLVFLQDHGAGPGESRPARHRRRPNLENVSAGAARFVQRRTIDRGGPLHWRWRGGRGNRGHDQRSIKKIRAGREIHHRLRQLRRN